MSLHIAVMLLNINKNTFILRHTYKFKIFNLKHTLNLISSLNKYICCIYGLPLEYLIIYLKLKTNNRLIFSNVSVNLYV